jgi:hypothetical protein
MVVVVKKDEQPRLIRRREGVMVANRVHFTRWAARNSSSFIFIASAQASRTLKPVSHPGHARSWRPAPVANASGGASLRMPRPPLHERLQGHGHRSRPVPEVADDPIDGAWPIGSKEQHPRRPSRGIVTRSTQDAQHGQPPSAEPAPHLGAHGEGSRTHANRNMDLIGTCGHRGPGSGLARPRLGRARPRPLRLRPQVSSFGKHYG